MRYILFDNTSRAADPIERFTERLRAYLPDNYEVFHAGPDKVLVAGHDAAGWTVEDYVIPRAATGLLFGHEVTRDDAKAWLRSVGADAKAWVVSRDVGDDSDPPCLACGAPESGHDEGCALVEVT